jgi:hypothetical protein
VELLEGGQGGEAALVPPAAGCRGRRFSRQQRQGHWYGGRKKKAGDKGTAAGTRNKKEIGEVVGRPKRGVRSFVRTTQLGVWANPLGWQEGGKP